MKTNKIALPIILWVALVGALGFTTVLAQRGPHGPGDGTFGMDPELMSAVLVARLGLSEPQAEEVQAIVANHREATRSLHEQLRSGRQAVEAQVLADPFDEQAIRDAVAATAKIQADFAVSRAEVQSELRAVLTPEQLEQFQELRRQLRGGMMGRREHFGDRDFGNADDNQRQRSR